MQSCRFCREVVAHVTELHNPPICKTNLCLSMTCSDNNVEKLCWYCLICFAHININYTFLSIYLIFVQNIEYWLFVSSLLLTSISGFCYSIFRFCVVFWPKTLFLFICLLFIYFLFCLFSLVIVLVSYGFWLLLVVYLKFLLSITVFIGWTNYSDGQNKIIIRIQEQIMYGHQKIKSLYGRTKAEEQIMIRITTTKLLFGYRIWTSHDTDS